MASAPQLGAHDSKPLGAAQLSLRALFAATFFAACLSRVVARFGVSVLVIVGAVALAATIAATIAASAVASLDLALSATSRHRPSWLLARTRFARCIFAGVLGGLTIEMLAGACAFSLADKPTLIPIKSWTEVASVFLSFAKEPITVWFMLLWPSLLASFSISVAHAIANRTATTAQSIAPTGCLIATIFGVTPIVLVIVWLAFFLPPPPPPGVFHENMLGLLPIAIPLWCAMAAVIGGASGVAAASVLALLDHAQCNRSIRNLLWCLAILMAILLTEAAVRGWIRSAIQ